MSVYMTADGLPHVGVPPSIIACLARECPEASARVKGLKGTNTQHSGDMGQHFSN